MGALPAWTWTKAEQSNEQISKKALPGPVATDRLTVIFVFILEGAARYAGLLLAPAEGFGLRPRPFFALRAKKGFSCLFWPNLVIFGDQ